MKHIKKTIFSMVLFCLAGGAFAAADSATATLGSPVWWGKANSITATNDAVVSNWLNSANSDKSATSSVTDPALADVNFKNTNDYTINFNPVINFYKNGTNYSNLQVDSGFLGTAAHNYVTMVFVSLPAGFTADADDKPVLGELTGGTGTLAGTYSGALRADMILSTAENVRFGYGPTSGSSSVLAQGTATSLSALPTIITTSSSTGSTITIRKNGASSAVKSSYSGKAFTGGGYPFKFGNILNKLWYGRFAEGMFFLDTIPNAATLNKIHSYLAIKYGITLSSSDYLDSAGNVLLTYDAANKNIASIGRDDSFSLNQTLSQSINSGKQISVATGNSFPTAATLTAQSGTVAMPDKSYVIWYDDGAANTTSSYARLWYVNNTGYTGPVSICIPDDTLNPLKSTQIKLNGLVALGASDVVNGVHKTAICPVSGSTTRVDGTVFTVNLDYAGGPSGLFYLVKPTVPDHLILSHSIGSAYVGVPTSFTVSACANATIPCTSLYSAMSVSGQLYVTGFSELQTVDFTIPAGQSSATFNVTFAEGGVHALTLGNIAPTPTVSTYSNYQIGSVAEFQGMRTTFTVLAPDHIEIRHATGKGAVGSPSALTIWACANSNDTCATKYAGGVVGSMSATGTPVATWPTTGASFDTGSTGIATVNLQLDSPGSVVVSATSLSPAATAATSVSCNFGSPTCTFTVPIHHLQISHPTGSSYLGQLSTFTLTACMDAACTPYQTAKDITGNLLLGATSYPFTIAAGSDSATVDITPSVAGTLQLQISGGGGGSSTDTCKFGSTAAAVNTPCNFNVQTQPDHIEIRHATGTGTVNSPNALTIWACANATDSCATKYTGGVIGTMSVTGTPVATWPTTGASFDTGSTGIATVNLQLATAGSVVVSATSLSPAATAATPVTCNFGSPTCTFTTAQPPLGSPVLWLKADSISASDGTAISEWVNSADSAKNATQSDTSKQPFIRKSNSKTINFNPVVEFTNNDTVIRYLTVGAGFSGTESHKKMHFSFVAHPLNGGNTYLFGEIHQKNGSEKANQARLGVNVPWDGLDNFWDGGSTTSRVQYRKSVYTEPAVFSFGRGTEVSNSADDLRTMRENGSQMVLPPRGLTLVSTYAGVSTTSTASLGNNQPFYIGYGDTAVSGDISTAVWKGRFAEVLYYLDSASNSSPIDNALQDKVESYLALKYGTTLNSNKYLNSTGTAIWSDTTYKNNIAGIAIDSGFSLDQRISKSESIRSVGQITAVKGSAFPTGTISAQSGDAFAADKQYFIFGDNGDSTIANLVWKVQTNLGATADTDKVTICIPNTLNADATNNTAILYGDDTASMKNVIASSGTASCPVAGGTTTTGKLFTFAGGLLNGKVFQLGDPELLNIKYFLISHSGHGEAVACEPSTFTITACANDSCSKKYKSGVSGTFNVWAMSPTSQNFSWPADLANTTTAKNFTIDSSGITTVSLWAKTPGTVGTWLSNIPSGKSWSCDFTNPYSCSFTTANAGFLVNDVPNAISGETKSWTIRAVKKTDSTTACVAALQGVNTITLADKYAKGAGASESWESLSPSEGSTITLAFDTNGKADLSRTFKNVAKRQMVFTHTDADSTVGTLSGISNTFIVAPKGFKVERTNTTDPLIAGTPFGIKVTAMQAGDSGDIAASLLGEVTGTSDKIDLSWANPDPAAGNCDTDCLARTSTIEVNNTSSGAGSTTLTWPEVGKVDIKASMSSYLGYDFSTAPVTSTLTVGAFRPHHFDVAINPACNSASYAGQPFSVTVKALNQSGVVTQNYAGIYAKAVTLSAVSSSSAPNQIAGVLSGSLSIPAASFDTGVATQTGVIYSFTTPPQTDQISVTATDTDTVTGTSPASTIQSGRVRILNAYGSEFLNLPVPMKAEYWTGSRWATNTADNCSKASIKIYKAGTTTEDSSTCVMGSASCAAPASLQFRQGGDTGFNGNFNLVLKKPGAGNASMLDVEGIVDTWMQFPWAGSAGKSNPKARVIFGKRSSSPVIYMRSAF